MKLVDTQTLIQREKWVMLMNLTWGECANSIIGGTYALVASKMWTLSIALYDECIKKDVI